MNNQSNNSSWDISTRKDSIKTPEPNTILDNFLFISNAYCCKY